ncbi:MAG: SPASM domain-containing protein, partial [Candidatus Cloacimonetes bacterium]|nr:SPASM domain-containing protein [Candidatus Cloacimonadota bacterium]
FKQCEANIDMLALDLYGDIYTCLEVVGKEGWSVGKFYPELDIDEEKLNQWRERDIFKTGCTDCEVALSCGGGCAILAYEKTGLLYSHYCKPVKKALELAIPFYYSELKKLSEVMV